MRCHRDQIKNLMMRVAQFTTVSQKSDLLFDYSQL